MSFTIPQPLKVEHDHLHQDLSRAITQGGRTGEAARVVAQRLHAHFHSEEDYALPPLGLLSALLRGDVPPEDTAKAIGMADRLEAELPRMLAEHREIVAALRDLTTAARDEGHDDTVAFAEALVLHARTEEEVLYPATILLGRYLKLAQGDPQAD
ncbi:hemerythrin domain-containing protein [Rubellimicrobium mesophilum]|nr:hemerythrin domain-containing protein [Rubellimicrobium mesophilum]